MPSAIVPGVPAFNGLTDVQIVAAAIGDLVQYNGSKWINFADVAIGSYLASGGVGVIPSWQTLNQAAIDGLKTTQGPTFDCIDVVGSSISRPRLAREHI